MNFSELLLYYICNQTNYNMNVNFTANMIKNEVEIILKELKLNHTSGIEKTKDGASVIIAFTDVKKCDNAYESLKVRYNHKVMFETFKIDIIKKANYIVRINIY